VVPDERWSLPDEDGQEDPGPAPAADLDALVEPDADVIAGRHPVEEAFAARRAARRLLVVPHRRAALENLVLHAATIRIPVVEVEGGTLTSLAGFDGHQGVALVVEPRRDATLEEIIGRATERGERPFVLVLDSLEDPQNLGTLLRSAEAAGVHGVVVPTRRAAPLTPAAIKASAGAVEHLLVAPVDDLPGALADLRARGIPAIGADQEANLAYRDADLRGPVAIVVGSEGSGLTGPVRRRLDSSVRIPMAGKVGSLNAAVAGSILLFEAAAQRAGAADPPPEAATEPPGKPPAEPKPRAEPKPKPEPKRKAKAEPKPKAKSGAKADPKGKAAKAKPKGAQPAETGAPAVGPQDELLPGKAEAPRRRKAG
jgi:23S rRNA (guanosine2251-2'-O)-methyltransferase